jgi:hypothetical protein
MHPPLRIEVPDEEHVERSPERRVVDVLNAVDRWLPTAGVPLVKVHLDGTSYTLSAPATGSTDAA